MANSVLRVEGIVKAFGGVHALRGVGLEIGAGEIHCLAGENGSGKSTLIKVISGVLEPDAGRIHLGARAFSRLSPMEAIALGVQVIYQDFSVFPNLSVMENLALNMELMDNRKLMNYRRARSIAAHAVSLIGFEVDLDERVENLTVADRQLIAICRALLQDSKLIIMDEPTSALTKKEVKALFAVIKSLQSQGISVLFVSHKLDEVFEISERYTIIRSGENAASGNTRDLDRRTFAYHMTGREFTEESYRPSSRGATPLLSVEGLALRGSYSDISFDLYPGEILGITGLLGSGRTELVETIFGILRPDAGRIKIEGRPVRIRSVKAAIRQGIGYVPSDRLTEGLFQPQTIARNTVVAVLERLSGRLGFLKFREISETTARWIAELSIATTDPSLPVRTLSGGNQQKVVLARWLASELKLLILNGPTMGVDIGSKYDIHALMRKLADEGLAIIVVSDDLPEVLACASRIIVMRDGVFVRELDPAATTESRLGELSTGIA
ncbi:MAG TPA: sugar ABC transporter ATP-binding protein [Rectinemataceae bacterium]|nr:sugar ABC transporter ATP-binding protein [Rectinemataceae bacterium]